MVTYSSTFKCFTSSSPQNTPSPQHKMSTTTDILQLLISLVEYRKRKPTDTQTTCKLHTERPGINPATFLLWGYSAKWKRFRMVCCTTKTKYVIFYSICNIWHLESVDEWSHRFFFLQEKTLERRIFRVLSLLWVSTLLCCVSLPTVVYMLFKWWIMHRLLYET